MSFMAIMIISILIIIIITMISLLVTNSAYKYEHKVDPLPEEKQSLSKNNKDS